MANELLIVWAGRHQREPWRSLCADYESRIARLMPIRQLMVRPRGAKDRRLAETQALQRALPNGAWVAALDRRGRQLSSVEFSALLVRQRDTWNGPLAFVLGSDLGLSDTFLQAAHARLSFGKMTLPHELARLVLAEQLYRALAIDRGIKYHREPFRGG